MSLYIIVPHDMGIKVDKEIFKRDPNMAKSKRELLLEYVQYNIAI